MSCLRFLVIRLLIVSTNQRLLDVQHARSLAGKALRGRQQFSLFSGKFSLTTPPRGSGLPSSAWTGWRWKAVGVLWQLSAAWPSSSGCCLSASYSCCFFYGDVLWAGTNCSNSFIFSKLQIQSFIKFKIHLSM